MFATVSHQIHTTITVWVYMKLFRWHLIVTANKKLQVVERKSGATLKPDWDTKSKNPKLRHSNSYQFCWCHCGMNRDCMVCCSTNLIYLNNLNHWLLCSQNVLWWFWSPPDLVTMRLDTDIHGVLLINPDHVVWTLSFLLLVALLWTFHLSASVNISIDWKGRSISTPLHLFELNFV